MKLLSSIKVATIATIALTFLVLPNFAQDNPETMPTESTPTVEPPSSTFPDIGDNVYKAEIEKAVEKGVVEGLPDGSYKPDETVTREQAAVMIVKAIGNVTPIDLDSRPTNRTVRPFQDIAEDRWSAKEINWLQWNLYPANASQLTGNFRPEDPITRIELVDFLRRTAELVGSRLRGNPELTEAEEPIEFSEVVISR
jgi:hypothetical protein